MNQTMNQTLNQTLHQSKLGMYDLANLIVFPVDKIQDVLVCAALIVLLLRNE